jgi:hypothetical protein
MTGITKIVRRANYDPSGVLVRDGRVLLSALVFAQTFGEITGVVTDASGGAVVNAVVTVTNPT